MNTKKKIYLIIILIFLIIIGIALWLQNTFYFKDGLKKETFSSEENKSKTNIDNIPDPNWINPHPVKSWTERYILPVDADLIVLPIADKTRLYSNWCFEIREYGGRMIQALGFIAGNKNYCAKSWNLYKALMDNGYKFTDVKVYSPDELINLGNKLKTKKIIQIVLENSGEKGVKASAIAVDLINKKTLGTWEVDWQNVNRNFDIYFNIIGEISLKIAATLFANCDEKTFFNSINKNIDSKKIQIAKKKAQQAWELISVPSIIRLEKANQLANESIELAPNLPEAWQALTLSYTILFDSFRINYSHCRQEFCIRALTAGQIAQWLAPDDVKSVLVNSIALFYYGRIVDAINNVEEYLKKHPDNKIAQATISAFTGNNNNFPFECEELKNDATLNDLLQNILYVRSDDRAKRIAQIEKRISNYPFAPNFLYSLGRYSATAGELTERRIYDTNMSIQGSLFSLIEIVRQWEVRKNSKEAKRIAESIYKLINCTPQNINQQNDKSRNDYPISQNLRVELEKWSKNQLDKMDFTNINWGYDSLPFKLLEFMEKEKQNLLTNSADEFDKKGLRAGYSGFGLTTEESLALSSRYAIDGACLSFNDIVLALSVPSADVNLGQKIIDLFPDDLPILETFSQYYWYNKFNNVMVDKYQSAMNSIDFTYLPMKWRYANFVHEKTPQENKKKLEYQLTSLKVLAPFDYDNLNYIYKKLGNSLLFQSSATYAKLMYELDPYNPRKLYDYFTSKALAEDRLIGKEEVEDLISRLSETNPTNCLLRGDIYTNAQMLADAMREYESYIDKVLPEDKNPYYRLAFIYRIIGNNKKAEETIEKYLNKYPPSLVTGNMLVYMGSDIELYGEYDLDGAGEYLRRVFQQNTGQSSISYFHTYYEWANGNRDKAISILTNDVERYPYSSHYADLGWMYFACHNGDKALEFAEKSISVGNRYRYGYWLKSELFRRAGQEEPSIETIKQYERVNIDDAGPKLLFAMHYCNEGDFEKTVQYAKTGYDMDNGNYVVDCLRFIALGLINKGEYDEADKYIRKLNAWDSISEVVPELKARIELKKGNPEKALEVLKPALNMGTQESRTVAAQAYLELKMPDKALEMLDKPMKYFLYISPELRYTYVLSLKANGKDKEAMEQIEQCYKEDGPLGYYGKIAGTQMN